MKASSTRAALGLFDDNLNESLGARTLDRKPTLSPVANVRDIGRKPNRRFGRLAVDRIMADPQQPRSEFDEEQLQQLSDSLKDRGQIAPIRVRWSEEHQSWMVISGERRWRAAKAASLQEVDCYFHDEGLTRSEILEEQLIENMLRADLKPVEEAKSFQELIELNGYGQRELARILRISPARVTRALALLTLPTELQQHIETGEISARAGYEMSKLDEQTQHEQLQQAKSGTKLTHKNAVKLVRDKQASPACDESTKKVFFTKGGFRVSVSADRKSNYQEIAKALNEALEEVMHRLNNNC